MAWGSRDLDELAKARRQIELLTENLLVVAGALKTQPTVRQNYKAHILAGIMSNHEHSATLRPDFIAQVAGEIADAALREDEPPVKEEKLIKAEAEWSPELVAKMDEAVKEHMGLRKKY